MEELVAIARIVKTRGIKGEVVADLFTDFPERFDGLKKVIAVDDSGERIELIIEKFWFQNGRVVLKFANHDTIEQAEMLRNAEVCVSESDAVELETDEYFDWQLAGCKVENVDGVYVGVVRELMRTGGTELLVVGSESKEFLVPFANAICIDVDIKNKLIRIDPPEGLLEF